VEDIRYRRRLQVLATGELEAISVWVEVPQQLAQRLPTVPIQARSLRLRDHLSGTLFNLCDRSFSHDVDDGITLQGGDAFSSCCVGPAPATDIFSQDPFKDKNPAIQLVPDADETPPHQLAEALLWVREAWRIYWRDATNIWRMLFATFKGTSGKDWHQLKQQFCRDNVSDVSTRNVARLKTALRKAWESAKNHGGVEWKYLAVLLNVLEDLVAPDGRLSWKQVEVALITHEVPVVRNVFRATVL